MSRMQRFIKAQISSLRQRAALLIVAIKAIEQLKSKLVKRQAA